MIPSVLVHYSAAPLGALFDQRQREAPRFAYDKPCGLWVSHDGEDGWRAWCIDADYSVGNLVWRTEFEIASGATV